MSTHEHLWDMVGHKGPHTEGEEEPIYRHCFECGVDWSTSALVAAHNALLDEIGTPGTAEHVTDPAAAYSCPECGHDW